MPLQSSTHDYFILKRPKSELTRKSLQIKGFSSKIEFGDERQGMQDYVWLEGHAHLASEYLFVRREKKKLSMSDLNDDVDDLGRSLY